MPVPSQGNSAGSLDVVEAQVARKCGMQRLRGQAAPRLLSPVCISLAESNVHSSAKARPPARRIWDQPIQSPRTTRLCHRGTSHGIACYLPIRVELLWIAMTTNGARIPKRSRE